MVKSLISSSTCRALFLGRIGILQWNWRGRGMPFGEFMTFQLAVLIRGPVGHIRAAFDSALRQVRKKQRDFIFYVVF